MDVCFNTFFFLLYLFFLLSLLLLVLCVLNFFAVPQEKFDIVLKSFKKHANADGRISREGFKKILDGVMHPELADKVFDSFDRDHNKFVYSHKHYSYIQ